MSEVQSILKGGVLLALVSFASGCVVAEPREGFYDHDHHRYYQSHSWHECHEHDDYCR